MFGTKVKALAAVAGVALLVAACSSSGGSGGGSSTSGGSTGGSKDSGGSKDMVTIVAGVAASQSSIPLQIGLAHGFFKEQGIDLKIGKAAHGSNAIAQLVNGQQQVGLGGLSAVITASASNIPIKIVSGAVTDKPSPKGPQYQTIVPGDSGIKSFKDLAGKTVAVNTLKCCWEFWIREAVAHDGGDPGKVNFVQLTFGNQVNALKQGKVDAISTFQPYATELRSAGYRDIGDSPAIAFDNPQNGNTDYFMADKFVKDHPGIVDRWRKALAKASAYANSHPKETRAAIVKQTAVDAGLVDKEPLPNYTADIDTGTIEKAVSFAVKYGVIKKTIPLSELVVQ